MTSLLPPTAEARRGRPWRTAAIAVIVAVACVPWFGLSSLWVALRCDENCSGDQAESLVYPAQFVITLAGLGMLLLAGLLRLAARREAALLAFAVGAGLAALWVGLVLKVGLVLTAGALGALILLRARRERVVAAAVLVGAVVTVLLPTPYL